MSITEQIDQDLQAAVRARDNAKTTLLRTIKAALHNAVIAGGSELKDEEVVAVLRKEAKKRQEAEELYQKNGRTELAQQEHIEKEVIDKYLPNLMSEEELVPMVQKAIKDTGSASVQDTGNVMAALMPLVRGKADGQTVARAVKQQLEKS